MSEWLQENALLLVGVGCFAVLFARQWGEWLLAKIRRAASVSAEPTSDDVVDAYKLLAESIECPKATAALREQVWPAVEGVVCDREAPSVEDA